MAVLLSRAGALVLALVALGCGGPAAPDRPDEPAKLLLDGPAGAAHAGIYLARSRGYDLAEGVELTVVERAARANARQQLETGQVNLALIGVDELLRLRERGAPLVGVMAVVRRSPQLLLVATEDTLADRRAVVQATIRALQRGYAEATADPESAVSVMVDAVEGLDRAALAAELDHLAPAFTEGERIYGRLDPSELPDAPGAFDTSLVGEIPTE